VPQPPGPAPSAPPQTASVDPAPPPVVAPAPAESRAPASTSAEPAAKPSPEAVDGRTLREYRLDLMAFAKKFKRYPAQAMEKGWEGRVEIRVVVRPSGTIFSASIKTPSGYRILDDQALDMVRRAQTRTPIPPALRGREFTIDIPVIFELQAG
jgi:protein TonB